MNFVSKKTLIKRLKFLLAKVNISLDLALTLSWRQLYRLLKKASKIIEEFKIPKKELKLLSKDITSDNFKQNKNTVLIDFFDYEIQIEETKTESFVFISIISNYVRSFFKEHPILLN